MSDDPLAEQRREFESVTWPAFQRAFQAWKDGGMVGDPPPRPVRPHVPGPYYGPTGDGGNDD